MMADQSAIDWFTEAWVALYQGSSRTDMEAECRDQIREAMEKTLSSKNLQGIELAAAACDDDTKNQLLEGCLFIGDLATEINKNKTLPELLRLIKQVDYSKVLINVASWEDSEDYVIGINHVLHPPLNDIDVNVLPPTTQSAGHRASPPSKRKQEEEGTKRTAAAGAAKASKPSNRFQNFLRKLGGVRGK
jgi:hypothetical protein